MARVESRVTPQALWDLERLTYDGIAATLGVRVASISVRVGDWGFERNGTRVRDHRFLAGPCIGCMWPHDRAELNEEHLCRKCAPPEPTTVENPVRTITDPQQREWYEEAADAACARRGIKRGTREVYVGHHYNFNIDPLRNLASLGGDGVVRTMGSRGNG